MKNKSLVGKRVRIFCPALNGQIGFTNQTGLVRQKLRVDYQNTGFSSDKYILSGELYLVQLDRIAQFTNGCQEALVVLPTASLTVI